MAVTGLELGEACHGPTGNDIELGAHEAAVGWIDPVARAGSRGEAAAGHAGDVGKTVVIVGEPEAMTFDGYGDSRVRFELKDASEVLNVLQRNEIHVAMEFVIRGKQYVERPVLSVVRIAVSGRISEFGAQAG